MKNIVILISGTGSNMAAIVRAAERERWAERLGARVVELDFLIELAFLKGRRPLKGLRVYAPLVY